MLMALAAQAARLPASRSFLGGVTKTERGGLSTLFAALSRGIVLGRRPCCSPTHFCGIICGSRLTCCRSCWLYFSGGGGFTGFFRFFLLSPSFKLLKNLRFTVLAFTPPSVASWGGLLFFLGLCL